MWKVLEELITNIIITVTKMVYNDADYLSRRAWFDSEVNIGIVISVLVIVEAHHHLDVRSNLAMHYSSSLLYKFCLESESSICLLQRGIASKHILD